MVMSTTVQSKPEVLTCSPQRLPWHCGRPSWLPRMQLAGHAWASPRISSEPAASSKKWAPRPARGSFVLDDSVMDRVPSRTGNRHPLKVPQGVYPCQGDDLWIACAAGRWRSVVQRQTVLCFSYSPMVEGILVPMVMSGGKVSEVSCPLHMPRYQ